MDHPHIDQFLRRLRPAAAIFVAAVVGLLAAAARGQVTAEYDAKFGLNFIHPVDVWGWTPHNIIAGSTAPLTPDPGTGFNAWGVIDSSNSTANPFYSQCMDAVLPTGGCSVGPIRDAAVQFGWRYSTKARFVSDPGTTESMGLAIWIDNRGYFVLFDLDGGNLRAKVLNDPAADSTHVLTTGGVGATAYHDFALVFRPTLQNVAFEFDGVVVATTSGDRSTHDNALLWGNLSGGGRGQMNFNRVEFQLLVPGDYNRDGIVGAADYTVWRNSLGTNLAAADGDGNGTVNAADYAFWKSRFGMHSIFSIAAGAAAAAPEPTAGMLALGSVITFFSAARRRIAPPPSAN